MNVEWFGHPGHFICASDCRFHMCTLVGEYLISTVGELVPDGPVREALATSRGVTLEGRGDARRADYMKKIGFEEIGYQRKYETMVFRAGERCKVPDCGCGLPSLDSSELDCDVYNDAGAATRGHREMVQRWIEKQEIESQKEEAAK